MPIWNSVFQTSVLRNGFRLAGQTLTGWYQATKNIFSDEAPFFFEVEKELDYQQFQQWCSDLKHTLRHIVEGAVGSILFQEEKILSPFYFQEQLTKFEGKAVSFSKNIREAKARLKEQLETQPDVAEIYFYNDLINHLIVSIGKQNTEKTLRALLAYYKGFAEKNLYETIENTIKHFIERSNAYYREEENILNPLSDTLIRQVLEEINVSFIVARTKKNFEAEIQQEPFLTRFSNAIQDTKLALQNGFQTIKKPKTLATIGTAAALGYLYSISREEASSNRFNLNNIAFPSIDSTWQDSFYQTTNFISTFTVAYGINVVGGNQAFATPVSMVSGFSSLLQPIVAEPMPTIKSDGRNLTNEQHSDEILSLTKRQGSTAQVPIALTPLYTYLVGTYDTPDLASDVIVSGNLAYVADYNSGLQIVNVSTPNAPFLVGSYDTPGLARAVVVSGDLAYVADDTSGLQIVDVSMPSAPVLVGSYNTPKLAYSIMISDNLAYIADGSSGLQIVNVSTPSMPSWVGSYDTPGTAYGVVVSSNLAYMADGNSGLQVLDTNRLSTFVGSYDTPGQAYSIAISGNLVYVADGLLGLQIVDVSTPNAPIFLGSVDMPDQARGIMVFGNFAYVANSYSGLQIVDISIPSTPTIVGNYNTPDQALGIMVSGNLAYVADYTSGLQIVDVSTPSAPFLVGTYDTPGGAVDVVVFASLAYIADLYSGLHIVDVSTPSAPFLVGSYDTTGRAFSVVISDNLAYVADGGSGLQIVDVSTPSAPFLVGSYNTPGTAYSIIVSGNLAYVADYTSGLQIVDVSTSSAPFLVGSYDTPDLAYRVVVSGNLTYVADNTSGLQIANISTTWVSSYITLGNADDIALSNNVAYVTNRSYGLQIIDVSVANAPILVGNYDTPDSARGVVVSGNLAYVADYNSGLQIVNVSTSSIPTLAGNYDTTGTAYSVAVSSNLVYVADGTTGLQVIALDTVPTLLINTLNITQGALRVIDSNNLWAMDSDNDNNMLVYLIESLQHGLFRIQGTATSVTEFTQQQVLNGEIEFIHDGSSTLPPTYTVSVSDGIARTPPAAANVYFSLAPQTTGSLGIPTSTSTTDSLTGVTLLSTEVSSKLETGSNVTALVLGLVLGGGALLFSCLSGLLAAFYYKKRQAKEITLERDSVARESDIQLVGRADKGWTRIGAESGCVYALINKISEEEAELLKKQTGINVTFNRDKKKTDFTLGQGQFGKLRLGKIVAGAGEGDFVGVKKIKGEKEIHFSEREAQLQQKVSPGPHIMPLLDSVKTTGSERQPVLYQFMPLAGFGNGEDLQQKMQAVKNLDRVWLVTQVAQQLLAGFAYLHERNIFHLDFKLSNMVLNKEGQAYLIDFGCAQQSVNKKGVLIESLGDIRYFSPERLSFHRSMELDPTQAPDQARAEYFQGSAADLWALGITLIELLVGRYPLEDCSRTEKLHQWDADYFEKRVGLALETITAGNEDQEACQTLIQVLKGLLTTDPEQRLTARDALNRLTQQTPSNPMQLAVVLEQLETASKGQQQNILEKDRVPKLQDENYAAIGVYHYETEVPDSTIRDTTTLFGANTNNKNLHEFNSANDSKHQKETDTTMYQGMFHA